MLQDAIGIARDYDRPPRDFDKDGPHVVTGPVFVEEARPGDVLEIETLHADLRGPYGVVSSRHGKGALPQAAGGAAPAGITLDEVMPPVATDGRATGDPEQHGNVSVFTPVEQGHGLMGGSGAGARFPLRPFMGMMGVAYQKGSAPTDGLLNSIPPTLGGDNIDIRHLGVGSTLYLPVHTDGALFYVGDPHMAMGDGEVALTAMEGSLRGTFRFTVCRAGEGDAPSVAHHYPFAETAEHWIPIGLSDPDGAGGPGQNSDLDVAMRRAVVNALDFLEHDRGMERAVAYAYLSSAADFAISQVVDRTVGVHGLIRKADFGRGGRGRGPEQAGQRMRGGPAAAAPAGAVSTGPRRGRTLLNMGDQVRRSVFTTRDSTEGLAVLEKTLALRAVPTDADGAFYLALSWAGAGLVTYGRLRLGGSSVVRSGEDAGVVRVGQVLEGVLSATGGRDRFPHRGPFLFPQHAHTSRGEDLDLLTVSLDAAAVEDHARGLLGAESFRLQFTGTRPVSAPMARYWLGAVAHLHRNLLPNEQVMSSPLLRAEMVHSLTTALLHTFPSTFLSQPPAAEGRGPAPTAIRRAVSFIDAHLTEPIGVAEIAEAARMSPRGLQAAFRRELGTTPMAHLRTARLESAHRDLVAADPTTGVTVAAIAARWGFTHQGRFAASYRQRYGQAPTTTLRS